MAKSTIYEDAKTKALIGTRVLITGDHPWAGLSGEILRFQVMPLGICPVVQLDNGMTCFVTKPQHWRKLKGKD